MPSFLLRTTAPRSAALTALLSALLPAASLAQVSVLTQHNDTFRTGANLNEKMLYVGNVSAQSFGKLFTRAVDGEIYAQPLYVSNLNMPGYGKCNVVFVATMHNSIYAFDADDPKAIQPIWHRNLGPSIPVADVQFISDISTEVGILSTPVINPATETMYLVSRTKENGNYVQRLHAIDIKTGQAKLGGPVVIAGAFPGTGDDTDGAMVHFNPHRQNQRAGLLLHKGMIVVAWASHNDIRPYHGWVMTFDATTLQRKGVYCTTPDGGLGGIWQSGQGLTVDEEGNLHFMTGNGDFNANQGGRNLGTSFIKLGMNDNGSLTLLDWFTPHNVDLLNAWDADLGSAGVLTLPGTKYVVGAGKEGVLYLLDRNKLGHFNPGEDTQIVQRFQAGMGHVHGSPVYWKHPLAGPLIYLWSEMGNPTAFRFLGDRFDTFPYSQGTATVPDGMPGAFLSISANGTGPNTAILWASHPREGNANNMTTPGILRAFSATNLTNQLWSSEEVPARDRVPTFGKYNAPTVANGKVFLGTFSNQLCVFGLFASLQTDALNSGGASVSNFKADAGFAGGTPVTAPAALNIDTAGVSNPAPVNVYRTARVGNSTYTRGGLTPFARYTLRLHFADVHNGRAPRSSAVNVTVNGVPGITGFVVPRATNGTAKATVRTLTFNATAEGKVTIQFRGGTGGAILPSSVRGGSSASGGSIQAVGVLPSLMGCLVSGIEIIPGATN